jgi:hypothetical protein
MLFFILYSSDATTSWPNRRTKMESISFMSACVRFFGVREGQTKLQFGKEVQALTPADRIELTPGLEKELGVKIVEVPSINKM